MVKTLEDLAKKLKISRRTLSRVLKNDKNVSEETREKVEKLLKKENYYPNCHAASLASKKKTRIIGLVFPRGAFLKADYYTIEILRGVSQIAEENEFEVMFYTQDHFEANSCIKLYKSKAVGGLILIGAGKDDFKTLRQIKEEEVPFILVNSHCSQIDSVDCNNKFGAYLATNYLIKKGRRRIAFIHGHKNWVDAADRFEGYKLALNEAKIPPNNDYVKFGYFSFEQGAAATKRLLDLRERPQAIFAANDNMAMGVISAIKKERLKIPKDIAVIGFDDIPTSFHFNPSLTTVRQPFREIASLGTKRLIEVIHRGKGLKAQTKFIEPKLIVRESA